MHPNGTLRILQRTLGYHEGPWRYHEGPWRYHEGHLDIMKHITDIMNDIGDIMKDTGISRRTFRYAKKDMWRYHE